MLENVLAIDTSTDNCSVALQAGEKIEQIQSVAPRQHGQLLLKSIYSLIKAANIKLSDLSAIAVGVGPGSFMGTRIATSVVQAISFSHDIDVYTISSLQVLAQTAYRLHGCRSVVIKRDASMRDCYVAQYKFDRSVVMQLNGEEQLLSKEESGLYIEKADTQAVIQNEKLLIDAKTHTIYPQSRDCLTIAQHVSQRSRGVSAELAQPVYLKGVLDG